MRPRLILLAVLLLAPFLAGPAAAQGAQPLDRLLPEIRRNHPGQFLDAEGITRNGAPGYRLKWLTPDGRVISLDADARTGRVMGGAPDGGMRPREAFPRRDDGAAPERPRPNFQQNFDEAGGDDARARFRNRGFGPQRPEVMRDPFQQEDRVQRRSFGGENFGERFGVGRPGAAGDAAAGGRRGFGRGERGRGRGVEE